MGHMANCAPLAHRFVLEHEWPALVPMALCAVLIQSGHCQTAGGLHDVRAMWVVALDTIHLAFRNRMMLRQAKLRMDFQVTLKTSRRIFARIDDEFAAPAAALNMFAACAVARFAARSARELTLWQVHPRMRTCRENAH